MPPLPPQETSEAQKQAEAKRLLLAKQFEEVFAQPNKRTLAQKAVIAHLETCAGDDQNSYRFNDSQDGISRIAAGIHRDGAKSMVRIVDRQLQIALNENKPAKSKPKTVR